MSDYTPETPKQAAERLAQHEKDYWERHDAAQAERLVAGAPRKAADAIWAALERAERGGWNGNKLTLQWSDSFSRVGFDLFERELTQQRPRWTAQIDGQGQFVEPTIVVTRPASAAPGQRVVGGIAGVIGKLLGGK
ncbi:MAG TPA: hypothetical protein VMT30_03185 [Candidatus Saccharimonadia bacterium]|nr:hypothetical protein [Candidatus Saccharimonadia bacterium]